jgi:membrane protein YdbS with pleckstrin-like domain
MRSISFWASRNVRTARILLTISYLLLICMAFMVSDLLYETGNILPNYLLSSTILIYIITIAIYPAKKQKRYRNYNFRKTCDFILVVCSICMIICSGVNRTPTISPSASFAAATNTEPTPEITKKKTRNGKKELTKNVRTFRKELKASLKHGPKGTKLFLIVISSFLAVTLLLGVVALSCSLSCSGQGAAAAMVAVLGSGLVVFLLILAIRGINKEFNPKIKAMENQPESKTG